MCATWGLDIARSMTDAGGVGALLQIADHASAKAYLPAYDGNGNITALFDADTAQNGACVATYEYSPYGEFLRTEGTYAKDNPFRFSTKFTDEETGLVYYDRRYYSPSQGRFLGRDPKNEKGGLNLYGFCRNNGINLWDVLGMDPGSPPSYYGETVTVLEYTILADGKPGQDYVTYRAVYLGDISHTENGSDDNNLVWAVDLSPGNPGPTRGMPEPVSSGGFMSSPAPSLPPPGFINFAVPPANNVAPAPASTGVRVYVGYSLIINQQTGQPYTVLGQPIYHSFVVLIDIATNTSYVARAGPSVPAANRATEGWGFLVPDVILPWNVSPSDPPSTLAAPLQYIGTTTTSWSQTLAALTDFNNYIINANVAYAPNGALINSNSYTWAVLEALGFVTVGQGTIRTGAMPNMPIVGWDLGHELYIRAKAQEPMIPVPGLIRQDK